VSDLRALRGVDVMMACWRIDWLGTAGVLVVRENGAVKRPGGVARVA
jgi:hypothetical protein